MMPDKSYYQERASRLRIETRAFIDGRYQQASGGASFDTLNPATGEIIAKISACDGADVDKAVEAARRSFDSGVWSRADPSHRKDVLLRLAQLLRDHGEELAVLESIDSGKTITDCLNEVAHEVPRFFQWYGELIDKSFGKVVPTGEEAFSVIVREPIGVAGLIVPWNFPLLMAAWKLAPALAACCSVLLKPAEQTPLTALRLGELAAQAGLPDGVLNILPGTGEITGQAIGRHPGIDVVSFTGSTVVGAHLLRYASESNLKPVGLELGGKSPMIVLEDAEITGDLIQNATMAAFWNGGQNCSANMRQIVHQSHYTAFLDAVITEARRIVVGDPLDPGTTMGPMVSAAQRDRVISYLRKGVEEGARPVLGGADGPTGAGFFVQPTVFEGVNPRMTIAREEIFGPVLGLISAKSVEEAFAIACDTEYGLHASIFTRDITRALRLARRLPVGTVSVNSFSEGSIATPFGGYRKSGSRSRDNGTEALEQYQQTKTIWVALNG